MFSWMMDYTTLIVVAFLLQLQGPACLYAVVCAVVVLNSGQRFIKVMPCLMEVFHKCSARIKVLNLESLEAGPGCQEFKMMFEARMEASFGKKCPPRAILQSVRHTLGSFGNGTHFENCGSFAQHAAEHSHAAWEELMQLCNQPGAQAEDKSEACKAILKEHFRLGPFSAMMCCRYLSLFCGQCVYPRERRDLFQFSKMGLGLMANMSVAEARLLSVAMEKIEI